jgi:hypothetical protein
MTTFCTLALSPSVASRLSFCSRGDVNANAHRPNATPLRNGGMTRRRAERRRPPVRLEITGLSYMERALRRLRPRVERAIAMAIQREVDKLLPRRRSQLR